MCDNLQTQSERNNTIDIIKAVAIILVCIGHSIQFGSGSIVLSEELFFDNICFKIIYSFHMPLFMLISGYLFYSSANKRTWKNNIFLKIQTLIVPNLFWSIIPFMITLRNRENSSFFSLVIQYFSVLMHNNWFLWAVFWCSFIVIITRYFLEDNLIFYLAFFSLSFFLFDEFNLNLYKYMYPYFLLGYFFHKFDGKRVWKKVYNAVCFKIIIGILFVFLLLNFDKDMYIYTSGYQLQKGDLFYQLYIDLFRLTIGVMGSICAIYIVTFFEKYISDRIRNLLIYIGKNTMGIYIVSVLVQSYFLSYLTKSINGISYILVLFETIYVMLISILCIKVIKICPILNKLLLGQKYYREKV